MGISPLAYAVLAALVCIYHLFHAQDFGHAPGESLHVVLFGFMGWWTYNGAGSFHEIVRTKGGSLMHLMNALEDLRKNYNVNFRLIIAVPAILVIAIIVAGIMAMQGSPS